jgi:3-oxoacyl-[acyl-carrier-protein] synthase III
MPPSAAHLAGVGISSGNDTDLDKLATSAGTKALLDAGITYSDVDHGVACFLDEQTRISRSVFSTYGTEGAPVSEVDNHSGLFAAVQSVRGGQSNCVLIIAIDRVSKSASVPVLQKLIFRRRSLATADRR